jgi:hypothetical protein
VPPWASGEETKPAPMPLLLVQSFVNTWDADHRSDLLLDPAAARDWLAQAGLWNADRAPDPAELHLARGVREGIRALLVANSGGATPAPGDLQPLQAIAQASRPAVQVGPGGQVSLGPDPAGPPGAGTAYPAAGDPRRPARWHLAATQGLRQPGLPVGLLRPLPQRGRRLVRHGHLRQPDQEPQTPATAALTRRPPGRPPGSPPTGNALEERDRLLPNRARGQPQATVARLACDGRSCFGCNLGDAKAPQHGRRPIDRRRYAEQLI